jgi:AraC-like DNA-binding protein/mannose-6-phosphate isomerase-like protein (cupin superfamily)
MIKKRDGFQGQKAIVLPGKIISDLCMENQILQGIHVTDIGYYPKAKHHFRRRLHGTNENILIHCVEGKGTAVVDKRQYQLRPDSFLIIPVGSAHSYAADAQDSWTIYWMHFKGQAAPSIVDTIIRQLNGHLGSVHFQQKRIHLFEEIYSSLERGYSSENLCYANMCVWHYLSSFMYHEKFRLSESKQSNVNDLVEMAINYMQDHLAQMLTLAEIAGFINVSAPHLSSVFRKKTGFAPIEYFLQLKVQKACQFLIFTDLRIHEIAEKLGIEDQFYFSRMFRKLMGVSPNQYRTKRGV